MKVFFVTTIQELNSTQHFLETSKRFEGTCFEVFVSTMHVMEATIASCNGASGGYNMIEKGVANFVVGVRLGISLSFFVGVNSMAWV